MTPELARLVLMAWRPGIAVEDDPRLTAALELARRDPDLGRWLRQREAFHTTLTRAVREVPVPADLADRILSARVVSRPRFRPYALWTALAAAAALILFVGLRVLLPRPDSGGDSLDTFRTRMVRTVLREYRMDVVTNDLSSIRAFLATRNAPADFVLPPGLATLPPMGGGRLSWQGRGVSMVCLDGGRLGTLFLFIAPSSGLPAPSTREPQPAQVNRLATLSWTEGTRTYVLAADASLQALEALL